MYCTGSTGTPLPSIDSPMRPNCVRARRLAVTTRPLRSKATTAIWSASNKTSYGMPGAEPVGSGVATHDEVAETSEIECRKAGSQPGTALRVHFHQHLALPVQRGDDVATLVRNHELHDRSEGAEPARYRVQEHTHAVACDRGHNHGVRLGGTQPLQVAWRRDVSLVEDD